MAVDDKFVKSMLLIGVAIVILVILVTQYKKKTGTTVQEERFRGYERYVEPTPGALFNDTQNRSNPVDALLGPSPTTGTSTKSNIAATSGGTSGTTSGSTNTVQPSEPLNNEDYKAIDFTSESKLPSDCFPRERLTAEDLLPKDAANSKWAQVNPSGQGDVKDQNFLTAGHLVGINTVGQTLRNANYQLRSDPPNPKFNVGPWNQTTIEYDNSRRSFELGEC
jgi:hypothetical protein